MEVEKSIGQKLKELRGKKSLREVAEKVGCDFSHLGRLERGQKPSIDLLEKLAEYYDVPVGYFFDNYTDEEKTFINEVYTLNIEDLKEKYKLIIDDREATNDEIERAIEYIKALRIIDQSNGK